MEFIVVELRNSNLLRSNWTYLSRLLGEGVLLGQEIFVNDLEVDRLRAHYNLNWLLSLVLRRLGHVHPAYDATRGEQLALLLR